jgi:hypothetical protein
MVKVTVSPDILHVYVFLGLGLKPIQGELATGFCRPVKIMKLFSDTHFTIYQRHLKGVCRIYYDLHRSNLQMCVFNILLIRTNRNRLSDVHCTLNTLFT